MAVGPADAYELALIPNGLVFFGVNLRFRSEIGSRPLQPRYL
jgi:hypothetical protein